MTDPDKIKAYGLTQVYCSDETPQVDIVFVHGLNGHPYHTWTSKSGVFWPSELLPQFLDRVRILTYGYNAEVAAFKDGSSRDHIHHHAETLASGLAANRNLRKCPERPIIFVCHSLGGLVVKRTLIYCRSVVNEKIEHLRSVFVSTYGILFMGTPHNGSDMAKWGTLLQNICSAVLPKKIMESSSQLINSLQTDNETLQNINGLFADIIPRFHIYFFHETRSTDVKGTRQLIVDESSAAPYVEGVERMGIEADHSSMCKFDDESAPGYEAVAEALQRYSERAPSLITGRWREEDRARELMRKTKIQDIYEEGHTAIVETKNEPEQTGNTAPDSHITSGSAIIPHPNVSNGPQVPQVAHPLPLPVVYVPPAEGVNSPMPESPSESPSEPFFVVPPGFHPNATFYGMERELDQMHNRLIKAKKRSDRLTAVLLHGVPGSGKTHLARQYIWDKRDCFPGGIFWVDAKSRQTTYKCYWEIAQAADLTPDGQEFEESDSKMPQKFVEEVRNWFQAREEWLLVFDGINFDQDEDLNHFKHILPFRKQSSIIYTSVDRTLARKQRLYEPYCLTVSPLREEDACKLLFKDIGINTASPEPEQLQKAITLVKHYECLPLAIHAISHRLSATGKPIQNYQVNSHLTDEKLAEPFLSIMHDLYRMEHFAALNLINLLSFLGHQVPVGLINLGRGVLESWNVEILTSTRPGDRQEIDTTLGTLIRYGLLERTSNSFCTQQQSFSSQSDGDDTADKSVSAPEMLESQTDNNQDCFAEAPQSPGAIDVIRIHSVVQGFCRDELKIMDKERNTQRFRTGAAIPDAGAAGFYDSWLVVATGVFCASYEKAKSKMGYIDYGGMVKDYREYETHGSRLMEHFPKRHKKITKAPETVRKAFGDLQRAIKNIRGELRRLSRNSSHEAPPKLKSVFDRTSSSSSSLPDSSSADDLSREPTFDLGDMKPPEVESPQSIPPRVQLDLFPPHIFREPTATGYGADDESTEHGVTRRSSQKLPQMVREAGQSSEDSSDWQVVEPKPKERSRSGSKSKDLRRVGSPKPAAPVLRVFQVLQSNNPEKSRRGSQASATESLAAVHHASPPSSRASNVGTEVGSPPDDKENVPTYASVAAPKRTNEIIESSKQRSRSASAGRRAARSSAESLLSRSSHIAHPLPFSPELGSDRMSHSLSSEMGHGVSQKLSSLDLRAAPEAHYQSVHGSTNLRPQPDGNMSGSVSSIFSYAQPPMPYEDNIDIRESRRMSATSRTGLVGQPASHFVSVQHPSAFMPGSSPPSAADMPGGYASDPVIAEPMSRGPSGNSRQSWTTDPALYPTSGHHYMASNPGMAAPPAAPALPAGGVAHMIPQHQQVTGAGGWIGDKPVQPQAQHITAAAPGTLHPEAAAAFAAHAVSPPPPPPPPPAPALAPIPAYMEPPEPAAPVPGLYFGHQPVDLSGARHRLFGHSPYHIASPPHVATYQLYHHPNLSTPMIHHPSEMAPHPPPPAPPSSSRGVPKRRGRSGSAPGYEGFGR